MLVKTNGVVIKTRDYKENDKLVWIFTQEKGVITAIAKGAKKSRNKLFSTTLPLSYCEYVMFKGKSLYNIQESKINNSFQGLLDNLEKLTYSSYLCELIDISLEAEEKNEDVYKDFLTCLYLLNTDALDYELLIRAFELRMLKETGYGINFKECAICKSKINTSDYVNLAYMGGICDQCEKKNGIPISRSAYSILKFLNEVSMDKVYRVSCDNKVKDEIERVCISIISSCYSRKPKSLEMLKYIKER